MECIDVGIYLHACLFLAGATSALSVWRMKANAIVDVSKKIDSSPLWKVIIYEFLVPKSWLNNRGKQWWLLSAVSCVALVAVFFAYFYFSKQEWVCRWWPEQSVFDMIKNI